MTDKNYNRWMLYGGILPCILLAPLWIIGIFLSGIGLSGLAGLVFFCVAKSDKELHKQWNIGHYLALCAALPGYFIFAIPTISTLIERFSFELAMIFWLAIVIIVSALPFVTMCIAIKHRPNPTQ